jgi:RNA 3'-terminal phosphate cyclase (ATP)
MERGPVQRTEAVALVAKLPEHIGERELRKVRQLLGWPVESCAVRTDTTSPGPGNVLTLRIESEHVTELFTGFGEKGVRAERVAKAVCKEAQRYLDAGVPVGEHLADQLLLPLALAGGGAFRTQRLTPHFTTNADVIRQLTDVETTTQEVGDDQVDVRVG